MPSARGGERGSNLISRQVIGHSVKGRPIVAYLVGDPTATRTGMALGNMHGDEPAVSRTAMAIVNGPRITGLKLWVVPHDEPRRAGRPHPHQRPRRRPQPQLDRPLDPQRQGSLLRRKPPHDRAGDPGGLGVRDEEQAGQHRQPAPALRRGRFGAHQVARSRQRPCRATWASRSSGPATTRRSATAPSPAPSTPAPPAPPSPSSSARRPARSSSPSPRAAASSPPWAAAPERRDGGCDSRRTSGTRRERTTPRSCCTRRRGLLGWRPAGTHVPPTA